MDEADVRLITDTTGIRIATALEGLIPIQAPNYVASIPSSQWSGNEGDYYITVSASNVDANAILIPHYDNASIDNLKGPVWCVPAVGSFTIHTSALPSGTVNVLVQFAGVMGEAQYQVLADVYSTSQTYSKSEAVAKTDIVNDLTSASTTAPLAAAQGKALNEHIVSKRIVLNLPENYVSGWVADFLELPSVTTRAIFTIYNVSDAAFYYGMKRESDQKIAITNLTASLRNNELYISGIFK